MVSLTEGDITNYRYLHIRGMYYETVVGKKQQE